MKVLLGFFLGLACFAGEAKASVYSEMNVHDKFYYAPKHFYQTAERFVVPGTEDTLECTMFADAIIEVLLENADGFVIVRMISRGQGIYSRATCPLGALYILPHPKNHTSFLYRDLGNRL